MKKVLQFVADLKKQRDLIDHAISILERLATRGHRFPGRGVFGHRVVSDETRRKMSAARRKWWASRTQPAGKPAESSKAKSARA